MTTVAPDRPRLVVPRTPPPPPRAARPRDRRRHWLWLAAGLVLAFAVPFVLADTLALSRDHYYGLYALGVAAFTAAWARGHGRRARPASARRGAARVPRAPAERLGRAPRDSSRSWA